MKIYKIGYCLFLSGVSLLVYGKSQLIQKSAHASSKTQEGSDQEEPVLPEHFKKHTNEVIFFQGFSGYDIYINTLDPREAYLVRDNRKLTRVGFKREGLPFEKNLLKVGKIYGYTITVDEIKLDQALNSIAKLKDK